MNQKMNFAQMRRTLVFLSLIICLGCLTARAQTTVFTYQGHLNDSQTVNGTGNYLMEFRLFAAASGGTPIQTLTDVPVSVVNNVFTVQLNFTANNAFDGADRFLEIAVKRTAGETYTTLAPRQPLTAAPYSIKAKNATLADTSTNALNVGGTPAANIITESDPRLTDTRTPTAGSANYVQNTTTEQTSTDFNISGGGTANIFNARTQFNLGGSRVFIAGGNNLSAGFNSGSSLNPTDGNSFFGTTSGRVNTTGSGNAFFGTGSGQRNTTGNSNVFFGKDAGSANIVGKENSFVGISAGFNSTGDYNSFFGGATRFYNVSGSYNTFIGWAAGLSFNAGNRNTLLGAETLLGSGTLQYATAIGAGATVSDSNSVVLGRALDTVRIPGTLNVSTFTADTLSANTVNADTQFNIGGNRIFSAPGFNTFVGLLTGGGGTVNSFFGAEVGRLTTGSLNSFFGGRAGFSNLSGSENSFFGRSAGFANTSGSFNSFFGVNAGADNTTGIYNAFFGMQAGLSNSTGSGNAFFGRNAGIGSTTGNSNVFFGLDTGILNITGSLNTLIGSRANVGSTNLTYATALGAGAVVSNSNTIMLGRTADTVIAPNVLQVNVLGAAGDTSLCRNSLNQISTCTAGNLAEQNKDAAKLDALQTQNAQMLEQLKQQQLLIGELKKLVCANNSNPTVCQ